MGARAKFLTRADVAPATGWALRELHTGVTVEEVVGAVCDAFELGRDELLLLGISRAPSVCLARSITSYLARDLCGMSYTELGRALKTDHSCVIRNCQKIAETIREDRRVAHIVQRLRTELLALAEAAQ